MKGIEVRDRKKSLTAKQRLAIKRILFNRRLQLIGKIHDISFQLECKCPTCGKASPGYDVIEKMKFHPATRDTVPCSTPRCDGMVEPRLIYTVESQMENVLLESVATLANRLKSMSTWEPAVIRGVYTNNFLAALIYAGGLHWAYHWVARVPYRFDRIPLPRWREKVCTFLGQMPDIEIADCIGTTRKVVCNYRNSIGIPIFDRRAALEDQ